jgi:tetratricopeptide (TPR) repeat protein
MLWHNNSTAIKTLTPACFVSITVITFCYSPVAGVMGATTNTTGTASLNKTSVQNASSLTPYERGAALFNLGKYNESIAYFDKALAINPEDFHALYSKGAALLALGKYNESIAYFDKALAINPKDFYALYSKGAALLALGKYNESIAYFDKALAINPKDFYALYNKGVSLGKIGKYDESIAYFDKALAIDPVNTYALSGKKLDLAALIKTNIIGAPVIPQTSTGQPANPPQSVFGYYFAKTRTTNATATPPPTSSHKLH